MLFFRWVARGLNQKDVKSKVTVGYVTVRKYGAT